MKPAIVSLAAALAAVALHAGPAWAQAPAPQSAAAAENTGQDPTAPLTRVDVRVKYKDYADGYNDEILTVRADRPFRLQNGWSISTRIDVPIITSNRSSPDNPNSDREIGFSDALIQVIAITPPQGKWAFAFGGQVVFPTGSQDQFGTGRWQLVPTVAAVRQVPSISRGSFIGILVRDAFDIAGAGDRPHLNVLTIEPLFNWALPNRWFATVGPEIKFNTRDGWKASVPFDLTVGKKVSASMVASLQFDVPLIDAFKDYGWQTEFRMGFFF